MKKATFYLVLCIFMSMHSTNVSVAATNYGFSVGGIDVTSDNASNVTGDNIKQYMNGKDTYVKYDPDTKTLRMSNIVISRTGSYNRAIYNTACTGLKIIIETACKFEAEDSSPVRLNKNTTIEILEDENYPYGTFIRGGKEDALTIGGGASVEIIGDGRLDIDCSLNNEGNAVEGVTGDEKLSVKGLEKFEAYGCKNSFYKLAQLTLEDVTKVNCYSSKDEPCANNLKAFVKTTDMCYAPKGTSFATSFDASQQTFVRSDGYPSVHLLMYKGVPVDEAHFPDATFRNYLLSDDFSIAIPGGNGGYIYYSLEEFGNILADEIVDYITEIKVPNMNISSLEGIQYFSGLKTLDCSKNSLSKLDVSANFKLVSLECSNNTSLSVLGLPKTSWFLGQPKLKYLRCQYTALASLDLSAFPDLQILYCRDCKLQILTLPATSKLGTVYCINNELTTLDVSQNTGLTGLYCSYNKLTTLKLPTSSNSILKTLDCSNNQLETLNLSNFTGITTLDCSNNKITSLDVSNKNLTSLACSNNRITELSLKNSTNLTRLECYKNRLTSLDLLFNTKLTGPLNIYSNRIKGEAMTNLVANLVPQASTLRAVDHSDPEEGNEVTSEQVTAASNRGWTVQHNFNGWTTTTECALYDLWIKGLHVHNHGPVVTGTSYDAATNTLTLNNANITYDGTIAILSKIDNLNVKLIGKNVINTPGSSLGMRLMANTAGSKVTFLGGGELNVTTGGPALFTFADVEFKENVKVSLECTDVYNGMIGRKFTADGNFPTIIMSGEGTEVKAKGGTQGSVLNFHALNFSDGIGIAEPTGATFAEDYGVIKNNAIVAGEWVVFKKAGINYDLNGDGKVSTADIQIIINEMKKAQASQNMQYDLNGDGKISTADIQVIINEMKK